MKKKAIALILVVVMILGVTGCSGSAGALKKENLKKYSIGKIEYSVAKDWVEEIDDEYAKRYRGEEGQLILAFAEEYESVFTTEGHELFLSEMCSSMEDIKIVSEKEIEIKGIKAIENELEFNVGGVKGYATIIAMNYQGGAFALMINPFSKSSQKYSKKVYEAAKESLEFK